jgi:hypothetical protein
MGRALQTNLQRAKQQQRDEFYTQLADIENEVRRYRDQLRGKVVFCNCDDPFESNFFKYFANNFNFIGLKKLIATSYTGSPIAGAQLPLWEIEGLKPDGRQPFRIEINEVPDANSDGAIDLSDVQDLLRQDRNSATPLQGNGDFRSEECVELLKQADIVCTNPPFSLFRDYIDQLMEHEKKFLILGSQTALTYRETFQYIQQDRMWLGYDNGGTKWFRVPMDYSVPTESRMKVEDGVKYISFGSINWYTNLDTTKRHEELTLYKRYTPEAYPRYVNYDAIEVPRVFDIPLDYEGEMGVPITFLDKYNPSQFEIVGSSQTHSRPMSEMAERGTYVQGGPRFYLDAPNGKYRYTRLFDRLLIRHRIAER